MSLFSNLRLTIVKKLGIVVINLASFNLRIGNWSLGLNDWFWIHYRRNSIRSLYDFCVHFLFLVSYQVCLLSAFLRKMSLFSHLRLTIVKRLGIIVIDLAFFTLRIGNWSPGLNDWFWIHCIRSAISRQWLIFLQNILLQLWKNKTNFPLYLFFLSFDNWHKKCKENENILSGIW